MYENINGQYEVAVFFMMRVVYIEHSEFIVSGDIFGRKPHYTYNTSIFHNVIYKLYLDIDDKR